VQLPGCGWLGKNVTATEGIAVTRRTAPIGPARWGKPAHQLYLFGYNQELKPVCFLGDSLQCLRDFPEDARHDAGYQLEKVQRSEQPDDFKPMAVIGKGVTEIRVTDESGAYGVIYLARRAEAVYVLHAFQKKTPATSRRDIEIAKKRFSEVSRGGK
jgi:phage-related protein